MHQRTARESPPVIYADAPLTTGFGVESWDRFGTGIVSMRFISVHIGSLTIRLQPEYNVIVISNFNSVH
jgi:hypothetical protein